MKVRASGDPRLEEFDKWTLGIGNGMDKIEAIPFSPNMLRNWFLIPKPILKLKRGL